ncbi:hypothetical protein [Marmoricola sp. RAF53]|uniref:hypothetical protein n=1 Tax=Marmoricola sp. RAF53 TaxID=3233059 RepID=UPI003F989DB5
MTTSATPPDTAPGSGLRVLVGAALWGLAAAVVSVAAGYLIWGSEAGAGALVGGISTILVLAIGTWVVLKVATVAPVAALLAALVVFTAQGIVLLLTLAVLSRATDGDQVTAAAFAVIAVTVVWTTMFAVLVRREKLPLFDMSALSPDAAEPPDGPGAR